MRVQFQMSGGIGYFPGLAAPRTIEVASLDRATQQELTTLLEQTNFFNLPAHTPSHPGSADHHTYQITIEDGTRRHTVTLSDPVPLGPLRHLIEVLRTAATGDER
jgi:emfourin